MLNINFEFRKGILFVRLLGSLNKLSYTEKETELNNLIISNKFKYIVLNTNNLSNIDLDGLNCLTKLCYLTIINKSNLVICDKYHILKTLLNNNIPSINSELEVL